MAFIKQDEQTGAEENVTPTNPTISSASSTTTSEAPTSTPTAPTQKQGSGFANINRWLTANQQGAQNLGNQLATTVQSGVNEAKSVLDPAVSQINQQIQQGTNVFNPNAALGDTSNIKGYAGPESFQGTETAQQIEDRIRKAEELAGAVKDVSGRTELLKNLAPGTTQGGANLNQFLVQNTQPAWNKVAGAAEAAEGFGNTYNTAVSGIQDRINQARLSSNQAAQQAQGRQLTLQEQKYADERAASQRAYEAQQAQIAAQQQQFLAQQQAQQAAAAAAQQKAMQDAIEWQKAQQLEQQKLIQAQQTAQQRAQAEAQRQAQMQAQAEAQRQAQAEAQRQAQLQAQALAQLQARAEQEAAAKAAATAKANQEAAAKAAADKTVRENAARVANEAKSLADTKASDAAAKKAAEAAAKAAKKKQQEEAASWWDDLFLASVGLGRFAQPAQPQTFWNESTGGM